MLLSSYQRLRRYLGESDGSYLTDNIYNKRNITNWIAAVSMAIENYCGRRFHIESRTEYFTVDYDVRRYYVDAPPISTITSVYEDSSGLFDGSTESELSDYFTDEHGQAIVLDQSLEYISPKAVRVIYTGGLAYHGTRTTLVVDDCSAFTADNYVIGATSGATGIVVSAATTALVVENLFGVFEASETLTEYSDEEGNSATGESCVVASISQQSLAEAYPDIVMACEMQVRFMRQHQYDYENQGRVQDGTTLRRSPTSRILSLEPEVVAMIEHYKRTIL